MRSDFKLQIRTWTRRSTRACLCQWKLEHLNVCILVCRQSNFIPNLKWQLWTVALQYYAKSWARDSYGAFLLHLRLHFLEEIVQVDSIPVRCQWWLTRTVTLAGTSFPGRLVFVLDDQTLPSGLYIRYSAQGSRLDKIVPHSVSKK